MRYNAPFQPQESWVKTKKPKKSAGASTTKPADNGATTGHEAQLWRMADVLLPKLVSGKFACSRGGT